MMKKRFGIYQLLRRCIFLAVLSLLARKDMHAQTIFRGVLFNQLDSSVIPHAAVSIKETGVTVVSNEKGEFQSAIPAGVQQVTLAITAIGIKTNLIYKAPFKKTEKIYLDISASMLNEVAIKGLSAEDVVRIAVASIPTNYADSSYFDQSFYRRYQHVNGRYVNLFEATPTVMFRLTKDKRKITSREAYAVIQLRRTKYYPNISNAMEDNPADLVELNPVYHLDASSLDPRKFTSYRFSFDTAHKSKDYVIKYVCNEYSTDHHGVPDYDARDLKGETWETGELVIERTSFAIKKIHRFSHRHKDYRYRYFPPQNNKLVYNNRPYYFEFIGGDMVAEYALRNGKWYLSKIVRQYTDEFYWMGFESLEYGITDNFEWYSDSVSRYTTGDYVDRFYPKMATAIHHYDTAYWQHDKFPFHYADKNTLINDLLKDGPLTKQFYDETRVDELVQKRSSK